MNIMSQSSISAIMYVLQAIENQQRQFSQQKSGHIGINVRQEPSDISLYIYNAKIKIIIDCISHDMPSILYIIYVYSKFFEHSNVVNQFMLVQWRAHLFSYLERTYKMANMSCRKSSSDALRHALSWRLELFIIIQCPKLYK